MNMAEALTWLIDQGHAERDGSFYDYRLTGSGEEVMHELAARSADYPVSTNKEAPAPLTTAGGMTARS